MAERNRSWSVSRWAACLSMLCLFALGCVGPEIDMEKDLFQEHFESVNPGFTVLYRPGKNPVMSYDDVARELKGFPYLLQEEERFILRVKDRNNRLSGYKIVSIAVSPTQIDFKESHGSSYTLQLNALLSHDIVVEKPAEDSNRYLFLPNSIDLLFIADQASIVRFADAIYSYQQTAISGAEELDRQLAAFEPAAKAYRASRVKPAVSEEQRRLIVQANALTQQKRFDAASDKYKGAVAIDPTSYPEAYYNLALLAGQQTRPLHAIHYMKKYLLLTPDAKDARSAQDKIYEWELLVKK